MPKPRHEWQPEATPVSIEATPTRRRRQGSRAAVPTGFRNGMPEPLDPTSPYRKWYAYGGDGEDLWAGAYDDPALNTDDAPPAKGRAR